MTARTRNKELHVYPVNDAREHILGEGHDCWCEPEIDRSGRIPMFIHEAKDGRE